MRRCCQGRCSRVGQSMRQIVYGLAQDEVACALLVWTVIYLLT